MDANWRTLWQRDRRGESGEAPVLAGATAVLPGDPARVVVTVEISYAMGLTCDDTDVYRLSDGQDGGLVSIGYKRPFATPRIEVAEVGGAPEPLDDQGLHVQAYDLATGAPVADPWPVPGGDWDFPDRWRLGRCDGRPVAAVAELVTHLQIYCAVTGDLERYIVLGWEPEAPPYGLGLLTLDDQADTTLALVGRKGGAVWCYDLATEAPYCPPLTGYPGALTGARLGRWKDRPAVALLTDVGVSVYDLQDGSWVCHVRLGAQAHDVAFGPQGELAVVSAIGPMVVQIMS